MRGRRISPRVFAQRLAGSGAHRCDYACPQRMIGVAELVDRISASHTPGHVDTGAIRQSSVVAKFLFSSKGSQYLHIKFSDRLSPIWTAYDTKQCPRELLARGLLKARSPTPGPVNC